MRPLSNFLINRAKINSIVSILFGCLIIIGGCNDNPSSGDSTDFESIGTSEGNFGLRSSIGRVSIIPSGFASLKEGLIFDPQNNVLDPEAVNASINGREISTNNFNIVESNDYSLEISSSLGSANVTVNAPNISQINLDALPDTHAVDQPLTVKWDYAGINDGAIIVNAIGYSSGLLSPSQNEYTIPGNALSGTPERNRIVVISVRYAIFPSLNSPPELDRDYLLGLADEKGSYFAVYIGTQKSIIIDHTP